MDDPVPCHAYAMLIWWTTNKVAKVWKTGRSSKEATCCCGGLGQSGKWFMHVSVRWKGRVDINQTLNQADPREMSFACRAGLFPNKTNFFSLSLPPSFLRIMLGDSSL